MQDGQHAPKVEVDVEFISLIGRQRTALRYRGQLVDALEIASVELHLEEYLGGSRL
jgi:hypothetical protein